MGAVGVACSTYSQVPRPTTRSRCGPQNSEHAAAAVDEHGATPVRTSSRSAGGTQCHVRSAWRTGETGGATVEGVWPRLGKKGPGGGGAVSKDGKNNRSQ